MISYVNYNSRYVSSLISCWNDVLIYDSITESRFHELYIFDENFDPDLFVLAVQDNQVIGFILGIKRKVSYYTKGTEPHRGWIINLAVSTDYQRQGIGSKLLEIIEERLFARTTTLITLCAYSPNYQTPGIDVRYTKGIDFFVKKGYPIHTDAVSMQRDLWNYTLPATTQDKRADLAKEGITFRAFTLSDYSSLMDFLEHEFEPGWKRNVILALQRKNAEQTILLCVDKSDQILGYCMRMIDGSQERFGPIGIQSALRSKGLGGVLFDLMMLEMRKAGIYYAYFLWTSGAAIRFYERHGMSICRSYKVMSKETNS